MIQAISVLFCLHLIALHSSIALMEMLSWSIFASVVGYKLYKRSRFDWPLALPLGLLLALTGFSTAFTYGLRPFWFQFGFMRWILLLYAYYWGLQIVWSPRFERAFVRVWISILCLASAYAVFQCLTGTNPLRPHIPLDPETGMFRATGFFAITLTCAYVFGTSFFGVLRPSFKVGSNVWGMVTLILGSLGVLATLSRGAWLAAIITGFIYVAFMARKWLPYFVGLAGVAIAGFAAVNSHFNQLLHLHVDHSSGIRLHLWKAYFQMFKDHPFLGIGLFQGDKLLPEYYEKLGIVEPFVSHAHNVLLQWLAGTGVFGLLTYVWVCLAFLVMSWRLREITVWGWSLFLSQIFFHLGGLSECNFFDGEVNHMLILIWALVLFFYCKTPNSRATLGILWRKTPRKA